MDSTVPQWSRSPTASSGQHASPALEMFNPADVPFSGFEISVLKAHAAQHQLDPPNTIEQAASAIDVSGGHMRSSSP